MEPLSFILGLVIGALVGAVAVTLLISRRRTALTARLAAAEARADGLAEQVERMDATLEAARAAERLREADERERERGDARVLTALAPVRDRLDAMQRAVAVIEEQRAEQYGELSEQLRAQHDTSERMRDAATALSSAMQSNQSRGAWGEAQLRNLFESAGMLERVDFTTQRTVDGESGRGRPDAVVSLPGGKHLIIDAKAPMGRFLAAHELSPVGDSDERRRRDALLAEHAKAVRGHIKTLAERKYPTAVEGSPELVIAFLPSESSLAAALAADPSLLDDAFARGIALTSPVSLWSTLRAIAHAWRQEQLSGTAREMFDLSRTLYERLTTTAGHLDKVGRSLTTTVTNYNSLVASIETRVLPTARRLGELDAREPMAAPRRVVETGRALSAPELTAALELAYPASESPIAGGAYRPSDEPPAEVVSAEA